MTSTSADWAEWFRLVGVEQPAIVRTGLRVDTIHMALDAASRGLGVALGRVPLFDLEIETGQLLRLFDDDVRSGLSYWLVTMDADFQSEDVKVFRQWLLDELGSSGHDGKKQRARPKAARSTT
jgi:LysR family transcriptional regulator, glycine cleavage system transcriptional activator